MTEEYGVAVRDLLPTAFNDLAGSIQNGLAHDDDSRPSIPGFAWNIAASETATAIRDSLDCDVFELVARGWCFANEMRKYKDKPPGTTSIVYLGVHAVTTDVHPVLTLSILGIPCRPIRFTVELKANFETAAVLITDASIVGMDAGDCFVSAQLKYGNIGLHDAVKSRHLTLPGRIRFKTPLAIC